MTDLDKAIVAAREALSRYYAYPDSEISAGAVEDLLAALDAAQAPPAAAVSEEAIEAAYWDFDARHKGYGRHKTAPQSERDAFKWAVRSLLAAAKGVKP